MLYFLLGYLLLPGNYSFFSSFNDSECHAVIHGSGGMHMVDPLFQRVLAKECQQKRIPVIFDEVFTGFWRLGKEVGHPLRDITSPFSFFLLLFMFRSLRMFRIHILSHHKFF